MARFFRAFRGKCFRAYIRIGVVKMKNGYLRMEVLRTAAALALLVVTSGCVRGQRVLSQDQLGSQQAAFAVAGGPPEVIADLPTTDPAATRAWWQMFSEPELERLVSEAVADNQSLEAAWRRLEQSGYTLRAVQAARFPQGQVAGFGGQVRQLREGSTQTDDAWGVSAALSYEIDLWQRISASVSRAAFLQDAGAYELEVLAVSVAAAVCDAWLNVQESSLNVALLEQQQSTAQASLDTVEGRYRGGLGDLLGVYQQRELVAGIEALLPSARAAATLNRYRLAVLLGKKPATFVLPPATGLPQPAELPGFADVSTWIRLRPDVLAAQARREAATQEERRAVLSRLPSVQLSLQGATREDTPDALFDRITGEGVVQVSVPVFDGGRLRSEAALAKAARAEQEALYQEVLLQAEQEVLEAALLAESQAESVQRLQEELAAARQTLALSEDRYRNGLVEYLNVLTAQQRMYQVERGLLRARRQHLTYQVQLGRATAGAVTDRSRKEME